MKKKKLSNVEISDIIEQAWCDKTSFENISLQKNLNENDVKKILKKNLKKNSYILWRKRIHKIKQNKSL